MTITTARASDTAIDVAKARWYAVNDDVMGGRSEGGPSFEGGRLVFSGATNTRGGGFSSIRVDVTPGRFAGAEGFAVTGVSDGRGYELNFTTNARNWGRSVSFRAPVVFSIVGEEETVTVRFEDLKASVWGRPLESVRFDPAEIRTLGFFIYDKKDGPFRLEISAVEALAE